MKTVSKILPGAARATPIKEPTQIIPQPAGGAGGARSTPAKKREKEKPLPRPGEAEQAPVLIPPHNPGVAAVIVLEAEETWDCR